MKLSLKLVALSCVIAGPALAADLPARRAPPVFVPPPAVFTWTGAYAGINAGAAFNAQDKANATSNGDAVSAFLLATGVAPSSVFTRSSGFTGGAQIGYNYQLGNIVPGATLLGGTGIVIGVEADAAYTGLHNQGVYTDPFGISNTNYSARTDFVGTARGRLGYAIDRFMVYGTGGFAYGGVRNSVRASALGFDIYSGATDKIKTGYAYGGGIEYAFAQDSFLNFLHSSAVTAKVEFIRYDLGTTSYQLNGNPAVGFGGSSFTVHDHTTGDLVRVGLNFKLGPPVAAPVVARY